MNWENYEQSLFALMVWREARGDGWDGMRAVAHVAWNRHKEGKPLWKVITDEAQFTSINPPGKSYDSQLEAWPRQEDTAFRYAMAIVGAIVAGLDEDCTGGALFYWNAKTATPGGWFSKHIAMNPEYEACSIVGAHTFFRPVVKT